MASRLKQAALGLFLAASVAGCVSLPGGGPVVSYPINQGPGGKSQPYNLQIIAQPPVAGWTPQQVVEGFLAASASFGDQLKTAREYLTPAENSDWQHPAWSATVFSSAPVVGRPTYAAAGRGQNAAQVTVTGTVQACLNGVNGGYAVPSSSTCLSPLIFGLVKSAKTGGQWRISAAPPELLLTSDSFQRDYQPRNLYFFDPGKRYLVPDPVYVPLQATSAGLMNELVDDLISPPQDWLTSRATVTALAHASRLGDVTLDGGTAVVDLGGAIAKAPRVVLQQVSAQLLYTLIGSGQGGPSVQTVELYVNGKPWTPLGTPQSPVQNESDSVYIPPSGPTGQGNVFYYLDGAYLYRRDGLAGSPVRIGRIGTGFAQIAVSAGGYLAALRDDGTLFTGRLGGKLMMRAGTGYTDMSWDARNNLWATNGNQIVMLRGAVSPGQPQAQPVPVDVVDSAGGSLASGLFTAIQVAPDGVRVAIIVGTEINFGAIVIQPRANGAQPSVRIDFSPFSVEGQGATPFDAVTWYGPDNVITLSGSGSSTVLTEYPVNGGTATPISQQPNIGWITANPGSALLAGLLKGGMMADSSLTGAWMSVPGNGTAPVYPG